MRKSGVRISAPALIQVSARAKVQVDDSVRMVENEKTGQPENDYSSHWKMSTERSNEGHDWRMLKSMSARPNV
jgi:hypothetical protein